MSLVNQYLGETIAIPGATILGSKAIASIEEGYINGTTTEYVKVGDFEVTSIRNSGPFEERLDISLLRDTERIQYNNSFFQREARNAQRFYDEFNSVDSNWSIFSAAWGVTNSTINTYASDTINENVMNLNLPRPVSDLRVIVKAKCTNFTTATQPRFNIAFRISSDDNVRPDLMSKYSLELIGNGSNLIRLVRQNSTSTIGGTAIATSAFTPQDNTNYWLMAVVTQNRIRGYGSTNGRDFTKHIDVTDNFYNIGRVALTCASQTGSTFTFDNFDFVELGNQYTTEEYLQEIEGMAGIYNVAIQDELRGVTPFFKSSVGSSWTLGTSNNVFIMGTTLGASWHTYITTGNTFSDYVATVNVRGSSGNQIGMMTGLTYLFAGLSAYDNFYGHYVKFAPNPGASDNAVDHFMAGLSGMLNGRFSYHSRGDYAVVQPDTWYRYKMVKSGNFLAWYINDKLVNSIYGASLFFSSTDTAYLGFMAFRASTMGTTCEFSDIRISRLDNVTSDLDISPNSNLRSTFGRYLPEGYAITNNNGLHEIFEVGASRGTHVVGLSDYQISMQENLTNNSVQDLVVLQGKKGLPYFRFSQSARVQQQVDSAQIDFSKDENVESTTDLKLLANARIVQQNKDVHTYDISIKNRPALDVFDRVTFINNKLGASATMLVYNMSKTFRASDGAFTERIQLMNDVDSL